MFIAYKETDQTNCSLKVPPPKDSKHSTLLGVSFSMFRIRAINIVILPYKNIDCFRLILLKRNRLIYQTHQERTARNFWYQFVARPSCKLLEFLNTLLEVWEGLQSSHWFPSKALNDLTEIAKRFLLFIPVVITCSW